MKFFDDLEGRYFEAGQSKAVQAKLTRTADGVFLIRETDKNQQSVEVSEISPRLGNVPRKITFIDGGVFECADNNHVDLLLEQERSFFSRLSEVERSFKLVAVLTVVCIGLVYSIYRYGLPALASVAANVTPPAVVTLINDNTMQTLDSVAFNKTSLSEERQVELTAIFEELVEISGQTEPPLKLHFRDGGKLGANALALPGGTIVLTDQLEKLAKNDDELAGVFAHEIGHVKHQHSLKQIYRALGVAFMISVIGGESEQIVEEVLGAAVLIDSFSYSRAFEEEADEYSVEVMVQTDRDPRAFVNLLDRVFEEHGIDNEEETGWFSTHPGNKDRRNNVTRQLEKLAN